MGASQNFAGGESAVPTEVDKAATEAANTPAKKYAPTSGWGPLVYPDDANPDNFYPEAICFEVKKRLGLSLEVTLKAATDHASSVMKLAEDRKVIRDTEGLSPADVKFKIDAVNKQWKIDHPNIDGEAPAEIGDAVKQLGSAVRAGHKAKGRTIKQGKTSTESLGTIYLNMPNNIQYSEDAGWNPNELGILGSMTKSLMGGQELSAGQAAHGGMAGAAGSMVGGAVGSVLGKTASLMGLGGSSLIGAGLGAIAAGSGLQKGAEAALSVAQNPYMEMMFSGIGFRQFKFDFVMRPKDANEVKTVAEIMKMFREHSHPSYVGGSFGQTFMNYPQEFHIKFLTADEGSVPHSVTLADNLNLPFLKPCVCTSVESNYTPQSIWTAYRGGASPAVSLGLGFQETELVMASDVQKGY